MKDLEKIALLKFPIDMHWHNGRTVEHPPKEVDVNKYKRRTYLEALKKGFEQST